MRVQYYHSIRKYIDFIISTVGGSSVVSSQGFNSPSHLMKLQEKI